MATTLDAATGGLARFQAKIEHDLGGFAQLQAKIDRDLGGLARFQEEMPDLGGFAAFQAKIERDLGGLARFQEEMPDLSGFADFQAKIERNLSGFAQLQDQIKRLEATRSELAHVPSGLTELPVDVPDLTIAAVRALREAIGELATLMEAQVTATSAMLAGIEELARIGAQADEREIREAARGARRDWFKIVLAVLLLIVSVLLLPGAIDTVRRLLGW